MSSPAADLPTEDHGSDRIGTTPWPHRQHLPTERGSVDGLPEWEAATEAAERRQSGFEMPLSSETDTHHSDDTDLIHDLAVNRASGTVPSSELPTMMDLSGDEAGSVTTTELLHQKGKAKEPPCPTQTETPLPRVASSSLESQEPSALPLQTDSPSSTPRLGYGRPQVSPNTSSNEDGHPAMPNLAMGEPGWERAPERALQKLPIRFKDCLGRTYIFPWDKVKTFWGMKQLINAAFVHVGVIGPHVRKGYYDLVAHEVWAEGDGPAVNPVLASYPTPPSAVAGTLPPQSSQQAPSDAWPSASPPGSPVSSAGSIFSDTSHLVPVQEAPGPSAMLAMEGINLPRQSDVNKSTTSAIILPDCWEDIVEPGMLISMIMWPLPAEPTPQLQPQPQPQPLAPPPVNHSYGHPLPGAGRGRGAFLPIPPGWHAPSWQPPHHHPPPPMTAQAYRTSRGVDVTKVPQRGKTRKRQEGC